MATRRVRIKARKTRRHSGGAGNAFTRLFRPKNEVHAAILAADAAARRAANNAARLGAVTAVVEGRSHEQRRRALTTYKRRLLDKYLYSFEYLDSIKEEDAKDLFEFCDGAKESFKFDPMLFKDKNKDDLIKSIFDSIHFKANDNNNILEVYTNIKNLVDKKIWSISNGKLVIPKPPSRK